MNNIRFSIGEALKWGFKQFFNHSIFFILVGLAFLGVIVLAAMCIAFTAILVAIPFAFSHDILSFLRNLFPIVIGLIAFIVPPVFIFTMYMGLIKIGFNIYDYDRAEVKTLFSQWRLLLPCLVVFILLYVVIFIGSVFFIIPGFYLMARYFFSLYVLIDKPYTETLDTFHESTRLTEGARWRTFGLFILETFISCIPLLMPVVVLSKVYAYRRQQETKAQLPAVVK